MDEVVDEDDDVDDDDDDEPLAARGALGIAECSRAVSEACVCIVFTETSLILRKLPIRSKHKDPLQQRKSLKESDHG